MYVINIDMFFVFILVFVPIQSFALFVFICFHHRYFHPLATFVTVAAVAGFTTMPQSVSCCFCAVLASLSLIFILYPYATLKFHSLVSSRQSRPQKGKRTKSKTRKLVNVE